MKVTGLNSYRSWGAAVAGGIVNLLLLVPARLSGLFYVIFISRYNVDRAHAALPMLIFFILRCVLGPFVSYFADIFGCRAVILWGSVFGSVGLGACFFAESIEFIYVSLGVVYGLGFAMTNPLIPLVLKYHFDKHLSKANGITLTGICLSATIICPLYEYFLDIYGEDGALLLVSGIMLHAIPAAILLDNPKYALKLPDKESSNKDYSGFPKEAHPKFETAVETVAQKLDGDSSDFVEVELHSNSNASNIPNEGISKHLLPIIPDSELKCPNTKTQLFKEIRMGNLISSTASKECALQLEQFHFQADDTVSCLKPAVSGTACKLHQNTEKYVNDISSQGDTSSKKNKHKATWKSLSVFTDPSYIIILLDHAVHGDVTILLWTIMIDMARDKGIPHDQEIYLLMFLPVAELIGYTGLSWVTDGGYLTYANFCSCCFAVLAPTCVFFVWSYDFKTMMIGMFLFGFFISAASTGLPLLVYKYVDEKKQSMALASRYVTLAALHFTTGPMIGYFRGHLGSYDWILYIMAIACLFGACITIFLPHAANFSSKRQQKL